MLNAGIQKIKICTDLLAVSMQKTFAVNV